MFNDDKAVLDTSLLRMGWAVDDVAAAVAELMDRLETIRDPETIDKLGKLLNAMNVYIRVVRESIDVSV